MAGTGYYLYGITKDMPLNGMVCGIDGEGDVSAISFNGIAGVVSPVGLDEFGEASLKQNLESLDWVRDKVFAHERVVEEVMKKTTVIPMKFCTIFTCRERVLELLKEKYGYFIKLLERYSGKQEWGVKVYANKKPEPAAEVVSSGREYLINKKARQDTALMEEQRLNALVETVFRKINGVAENSRINRPTPEELLPDKNKDQALNASLLLEEDRVKELTALVDMLAKEHEKDLTLELIGPLPVYSFIG